MDQSQVAFLVPLNDDLEEDNALSKIPLSLGPNVIGRHNVPMADKRLSRKHVTLTTAGNRTASLLVEGANPVVVKSGDERKKLSSRDEVSITNGCIIELIPGHHFFKFVYSSTNRNAYSHTKEKRNYIDEANGAGEGHEVARKKSRQGEPEQNSVEAIRRFRVSKDKLPSTFRLMRVQGLPGWANTSCVSIEDVVQGDITVAILSNYMVDMDWLMSACPKMAKIPHVLVIHGEGDGTLDYMQKKRPSNWILHKPPLPISYGTHHSKAMFLVYPRGVRVIVHTANLIHVDWNNKSQGLWMQDFPWKDPNNSTKRCGFENDLIDYLSALKWPEFTVDIPGRGKLSIVPSFFKMFDYSSATVRLIGSVPGYHTGSNLRKWGHMKLRSILNECVFDKVFQRSPLIYQFSSIGSLDEKWMTEFASTMSSGFTEDKTPLGPGDPLIIWPTVEDIRCSLEGYAAGSAVPSPLKNVDKPFLKKYFAKWKADHTGRGRAMPHIKTYTRYSGQKLAWFLLSSSNLSKAAWGALQKNNSQLMIRSYELGVLFIPSHIKGNICRFSCTDNETQSESSVDNQAEHKMKFTTLAGDRNSSADLITLPVPYQLPPQPYSSGDVPWSWDRRYTQKDVYGQVWPRI